MNKNIIWKPTSPESSQMAAFINFIKQSKLLRNNDYESLHHWSVTNPGPFWNVLCEFFNIHFDTEAKQPLNDYSSMLDAQWFEGATFNFAQKLLSRQDSQPALIGYNERGVRTIYTYQTLYEEVKLCAAGLRAAGIVPGDRVAAILPNIAQTIIAMLATTSIGAIWASCSPDFGADAIIERLSQIQPKIIFLCDGYEYHGKPFDTLAKMLPIATNIQSIEKMVVYPFLNPEKTMRLPNHWIYWDDFVQEAKTLEFTPLPFAHPLYILFSSGTTGRPKCIVHGAGGTLLQHIKELALHTDIKSQDNLCFYTTCGWMMWNWSVSTLALGATLTLYEGSPVFPSHNRLFELLEQEEVTVFGTSAKFLSTIEKYGTKPNQNFSLTKLRCILSTGSPLLPKNYDFVYQHVKKDVQLSSISGGTDIISCFALGNPILPVYRGELQCIGLGMDVAILNEKGEKVIAQKGELTCATPFPSMPIYFWNDPDKSRYYHAYFEKFPNIWAHGDCAEITSHHGLIIYGRSDTILNPGGVRIGTAEIYHQLEKINEILDAVVIGQTWEDDTRIVLFVQLREGLVLDEALQNAIRLTIRANASPRHVPAKIVQVPDIPRTINGKIVELAVRDTVEGKAVNNIDSIANPESLDYFVNRKELRD